MPRDTPDRTTPAIASELPLMLSARRLAELLDRSVRSIWRDASTGLLPRPIRVGRSARWRRDEILDWISSGCPARDRARLDPTAERRSSQHPAANDPIG